MFLAGVGPQMSLHSWRGSRRDHQLQVAAHIAFLADLGPVLSSGWPTFVQISWGQMPTLSSHDRVRQQALAQPSVCSLLPMVSSWFLLLPLHIHLSFSNIHPFDFILQLQTKTTALQRTLSQVLLHRHHVNSDPNKSLKQELYTHISFSLSILVALFLTEL